MPAAALTLFSCTFQHHEGMVENHLGAVKKTGHNEKLT
jgi:hypothetical protein